jgi:hypothetical protein
MEAGHGGDQDWPDGERAFGRIDDVSTEVQAKAEQFGEREEILRGRFRED